MKLTNQNRDPEGSPLRRVIYADMYGNWYETPGTDGTLAGNRLARYELAERGETVSDTEHNDNTFSKNLPDTIWAWTNSVGAQKWSDEKIVSHSREYIRAARGDEPEQLSDEDAQILKLVKLAIKGEVWLWFHESGNVHWRQTNESHANYTDIHEAIAELKRRLQPRPEGTRPQRPTLAEWYRAETESMPEVRRKAIRELIERHLAADKHDADAPQRPSAEEIIRSLWTSRQGGFLFYAVENILDEWHAAGGEDD